jgi:hypothetical protein
MQNPYNFRLGMIVVCLDNEDVESIVTKHSQYIVTNVSHRGVLINVKGVQGPLASTRFVPIDAATPTTPMEMPRASNQ